MPYGYMPPGEPRFGEVADAYDSFRVGYTALVWEHLARRCGLRPGTEVLDLGCGNGISTLPLIDRGANVVGVDPDVVMLERAGGRLEGRARLLEGRAEAIPLPDESVDLVIAAQAAQWFREPEASGEIRRVLRPGGSVAYLWKYPAPETPYVYLADELLTELTGTPVRTVYGLGTMPDLLRPGYGAYERAVFEQPVPYTVERYVGWVSSRDRIRQIAGEHREELLERLADRLARLEPAGAFVERNLVYVFSARRAATSTVSSAGSEQ
jgi:SAM-dependent methyltransferase